MSKTTSTTVVTTTTVTSTTVRHRVVASEMRTVTARRTLLPVQPSFSVDDQSHQSVTTFGTSGGSFEISRASATRPGYPSWTVNTGGWFCYAKKNGTFHEILFMNTGDVLPTTLSGQIPSSLPPFGDQWGRPLPTTTVTSVPSSSAYEPGCGFMTPQVSVSIIPYSHPLPLWNIPTPTSDMATGKSYRYFNICRMCLKKKWLYWK